LKHIRILSKTLTFSDKFETQGPFKNRNWDKEVTVPVTTLDELIRGFGTGLELVH